MTLSLQEDLEKEAFCQAGQVALEFLRANPPADSEDTIASYNRIFKEVYRSMLGTIGVLSEDSQK